MNGSRESRMPRKCASPVRKGAVGNLHHGPQCPSRDATTTGKALAAYPTSWAEGRMAWEFALRCDRCRRKYRLRTGDLRYYAVPWQPADLSVWERVSCSDQD